jgi:rRNA-processing protein EBP2
MAKKAKGSKKRTKVPREADDGEERLTLEALDAVSSEEEDRTGDGNQEDWNAEALALRQAIADGAFDHLSKKTSKKEEDSEDEEDDEEEENAVDEVDMESEDSDESDSDEEGNESDSDEEGNQITKDIANSNKALVAVLEEMTSARRGMPWAETFDIIPADPLPFGGISKQGSPLDIHDDLKREVAFYNIALESVKEARKRCNDAGIPFSRPEDFFAEMVKTDGKSTHAIPASLLCHANDP